MHPLPAQTVHLVLQYISPLTAPLPPHLISAPLHQRHYFLQISPSSPVEYLCWPFPDNTKAIDLLNRLPLLFDQTSYQTRYTSDPESIFAHVQISPGEEGLRMLFHWDDIHGWKYHDLRLMPFPSSSSSTPEESLAGDSAYRTSPTRLPPIDLVPGADHISIGSNDSCWYAYEAAGHVLTSPPLRSDLNLDTADRDDAYWAQYASVQGSADSTLPSPLPISRKLQPVNPHDPCPLQTPSAYNIGPSPEPSVYFDASVASPDTVAVDRILLSTKDKALTDSIKGLYSLWKAGKQPDEKDRNTFLRIVQGAIACEQVDQIFM